MHSLADGTTKVCHQTKHGQVIHLSYFTVYFPTKLAVDGPRRFQEHFIGCPNSYYEQLVEEFNIYTLQHYVEFRRLTRSLPSYTNTPVTDSKKSPAEGRKLSSGTIAGIVILCIALIAIIAVVTFLLYRRSKSKHIHKHTHTFDRN